MLNIEFQCAYCRLPSHPEGTKITHGMHDTCIIVFYGRDTYLEIAEQRERRKEHEACNSQLSILE